MSWATSFVSKYLIRAATPKVIAKVESLLPKEFPSSVAGPILEGVLASTKRLVAA
jgi:hypothetical protein